MNPEVAALIAERNVFEKKICSETFAQVYGQELKGENMLEKHLCLNRATLHRTAEELLPNTTGTNFETEREMAEALYQQAFNDAIAEIGTDEAATAPLEERINAKFDGYYKQCTTIMDRLLQEFTQKLGDNMKAFFTENEEGQAYMARAEPLAEKLKHEGFAKMKAELGKLESVDFFQEKRRTVYRVELHEGTPYHGYLAVPGLVLTCDHCKRQFPIFRNLAFWLDPNGDFDLCSDCVQDHVRPNRV
jgi:hypothetical protein